MPVPPGPPPRALRAALATAVAVGAAAVAHHGAHGSVEIAGAAWAFAGLLGPAWWLARRERGWVALGLTQLAAQQIAHVVLGAAADAPHAAGPLPAELMFHLHVLAAAIGAGWLRVGERRAWAAARRLARSVLAVRLLLGPGPAVPQARQAAPARGPVPARPRAHLLRHALVRRGPPLPVA